MGSRQSLCCYHPQVEPDFELPSGIAVDGKSPHNSLLSPSFQLAVLETKYPSEPEIQTSPQSQQKREEQPTPEDRRRALAQIAGINPLGSHQTLPASNSFSEYQKLENQAQIGGGNRLGSFHTMPPSRLASFRTEPAETLYNEPRAGQAPNPMASYLTEQQPPTLPAGPSRLASFHTDYNLPPSRGSFQTLPDRGSFHLEGSTPQRSVRTPPSRDLSNPGVFRAPTLELMMAHEKTAAAQPFRAKQGVPVAATAKAAGGVPTPWWAEPAR